MINRIINQIKLKWVLRRRLKKDINDINKFIEDLKQLDQSILRTMAYLCNKLKISLLRSKKYVLNSPSWVEQKEEFLELNNNVFNNLMESADEVKKEEDGKISLIFNIEDKKNNAP